MMADRWSNLQMDLDYDYIFMLGPPIRIGTLVKEWRDVYGTVTKDSVIVEDQPPNVGLIVESRLLGKHTPPVYWQYLVSWPKEMTWEDGVDLVTPENWDKTYDEWLISMGEDDLACGYYDEPE